MGGTDPAGFILIYLFFSMVLAMIPAKIASTKGRSFGGWWVYGFFLFVIATIHSLCIKPSREALLSTGAMRKCPECAELVLPSAKKCRYCGASLAHQREF